MASRAQLTKILVEQGLQLREEQREFEGGPIKKRAVEESSWCVGNNTAVFAGVAQRADRPFQWCVRVCDHVCVAA